MRLYFGLVTLALGVTGLSGAALSWDGSYLLFKLLDTQALVLAETQWRLTLIPLHLAILLASRVTDNLVVLQVLFSLLYCAIPGVALFASWWVVRAEHPHLFVWPGLSIGLGTLPGQIALVYDTILAIQLFWPILLMLLTGLQRPQRVLFLVLVALVFYSHPVAALLLGLGGGVAIAAGWVTSRWRRRMWIAAVGLLLLAVIRFLIPFSEYEASLRLTRGALLSFFSASVLWLPVVGIIGAYTVGISLLLRVVPGLSSSSAIQRSARIVMLAAVLLAGLSLAVWALAPERWMYASSFRFVAPFIVLPFMLGAVVDGLLGVRGGRHQAPEPRAQSMDWGHRQLVLRGVAVVFVLVLTIQSTIWFRLTDRLRSTIAEADHTCLPLSSIMWLHATPLANWATPSYALLLQGRAPAKLVLDEQACTRADFDRVIVLAPWEVRDRSGGWFDLRHAGLEPDSSVSRP